MANYLETAARLHCLPVNSEVVPYTLEKTYLLGSREIVFRCFLQKTFYPNFLSV